MTIQRIPFGIATVPVMRQLLLGRSVLRRIAPCHTLDFTQGTSSRFFSINSYYLSKDGTQETKGCQGPGHIHASPEPNKPKRIVVGITGATGAVYAIRILTILRHLGVETHLIISKWALATLKYETAMTEAEIRALSSRSYTAKDLSAPIASGSFQHDGMMIVPCSMKTLAAVRSGYCEDLIARAADVTLKEDRRLLLAIRETPLSVIHLENLLALRRANAVIFPPVPAFYTRPESIEDIVHQSAGRMLDMMGISADGFERWEGFRKS